ncbi:hypothetical protein Tco_0261763 [Tanacetum coccineum]
MSSDSAHSTGSYTSISSEARSWSIPIVDPYEEAARQALEQAPPTPAYVSGPIELEHHVSVYVPEPVYPEYLVPSDDDIPVEDKSYAADTSPTTLSPGYVADLDPEEDPEEDPIDYAADADDDEDEEEESSEANDEEEEEHLAPADSTVVDSPAVDLVPSVEEIKPFETNESTATPPPPPAYRTTSRIYVRS